MYRFQGDHHALAPLAEKINGWLEQGYRLLIACHQYPQAERLKELLEPYRILCSISEESFEEAVGALSESQNEGKSRDGVRILTGEISVASAFPARIWH